MIGSIRPSQPRSQGLSSSHHRERERGDPGKEVNNNNTLFVQYHEQEIPEVIPIEGIPFVNQSK